MSKKRPFVLTIAGFDPSAGAGILADIKTFEQHRVYGLAISTANTIQTENEFVAIQWTDLNFVMQSVQTIFNAYDIKAVKIGIVPSLYFLKKVVHLIKNLSQETKIIWDTVLKSTTHFDFLEVENRKNLIAALSQIDLITPNYNEIQKIFPNYNFPSKILPTEVKAYLLKGGHNPKELGIDYLYTQNNIYKLLPKTNNCSEKHGSGCVLSSAITAQLALGQNLENACKIAKIYNENYLTSNQNKLGYHYV